MALTYLKMHLLEVKTTNNILAPVIAGIKCDWVDRITSRWGRHIPVYTWSFNQSLL